MRFAGWGWVLVAARIARRALIQRRASHAGLLEAVSIIKIDQMLRGSGSAPGDYGFDPLGFASDPAKLETLQMKELANGRLAMFAISGFLTQSVLFGTTFPYTAYS